MAKAVLVISAACFLALLTGQGSAGKAAAIAKPNIVLIQTDDQTLAQLYATWTTLDGTDARVMPRTLDLIAKRGVTFSRYYASYPLCCPSRASLLSGRYAHHDGVISNGPPLGGWPGYTRKAIYNHNLAIWLQEAGYRTIHIGKFLNSYGTEDAPETVVPPGWDDWESSATDNSTRLYYGYRLNVNGQIYGPIGDPNYDELSGKDDPGCPEFPPVGGVCNYSTDAFTQRAIDQINATPLGQPFYLQLDYIAPHGDPRPPNGPEPAPRHYDTALSTVLPKLPGFNEGDVTDKPTFIRDAAPLLTQPDIRRTRVGYQKSLESLRAVDEGVARVIGALRDRGELKNTYVFFITDNGIFNGEHRLDRAKFLPYEPAIHLPLLVRGPGIKPGIQSGELVGNIDLAPTILQLAGGTADRSFDGRSFKPFWENPEERTRRPFLLESFVLATDLDGDGNPDRSSGRRITERRISAPLENYLGVRLGPYAYFEYQTGDRELYDLRKDPNELNNRVRDPRFDRVQAFLREQINRLEGCASKRECDYVTGPIPEPGPPGRAQGRIARTGRDQCKKLHAVDGLRVLRTLIRCRVR